MERQGRKWKRLLAIGASCVAMLWLASAPVNAASNQSPPLTPVVVQPPAPPTDFNALTASASQLKAYGFPTRPPGGTALKNWVTAMKAAKYYVPAGSSSTGATPNVVIGTSYSTNWAGYEVPSANNGGISVVETSATWVEPYFSECLFCAGVPAFWTGIGNNNLVQAGASSAANRDGGSTQYEFFYEDVPYSGPSWQTSPVVYSGDTLYADVTYNGNQTATAFLENMTTGAYHSYNFTAPDYSGSSAEFIYEAQNPSANGYPSWPSNSTITTFSGCQLFASSGSGGLFYTFATVKDVMTSTGSSSGTVEGTPGAINTNTGGFSVLFP